MQMVNFNELLNKTLYFATYNVDKEMFVENNFKENIIYNDFPLEEKLYWKGLRNTPNAVNSWFKGICTYQSIQHLIIKKDDGHLEENFSNLIGCQLCATKEKDLALYMAMQDYSEYKRNAGYFFMHDLEHVFPNVDFSEGIPNFIYQNIPIFEESIQEKIYKVNRNFLHFKELHNEASSQPDFCFIQDFNNFNDKNLKKKYIIFDLLNQEHINIETFILSLKEIIKTNSESFYIGIIANKEVQETFSEALKAINNE